MAILHTIIAVYVVWGALIVVAGDGWIERMYEEGSWGRQHPMLLTFGFWLMAPPILIVGGLAGLIADLLLAIGVLTRRDEP
jgi:hypothetical protein